MVRGIRGATTVNFNASEDIINETKILLTQMINNNNVQTDDIVSVIFTSTQDLTAEFPAKAARELGWVTVPLLGSVEANIENSLKKCIRVLMHVNTELTQSKIQHIYLNNAKILRPDLTYRG